MLHLRDKTEEREKIVELEDNVRMIKAKYKLAMGEHSLEIRKNFVTIGML